MLFGAASTWPRINEDRYVYNFFLNIILPTGIYETRVDHCNIVGKETEESMVSGLHG